MHPTRSVVAAAALLAACTGQVTSMPAQNVPAQNTVVVDVTPKSAFLLPGASAAFAAQVTGTANTEVTWSVQEGVAGGAVTAAGLYTAPRAAGAYHVVATSKADPASSGTATATVTTTPPPITVSVNPSTASISSCQSFAFTATVTGTSNTAVTWSVQEGAAGGTITPAGVFLATSSAGTYHVIATSQADPTKSQLATVMVTDKILGVEVVPSQVSLATGGSAQFSATVTTTCGKFTAAGGGPAAAAAN
jgi:hypothetical protein